MSSQPKDNYLTLTAFAFIAVLFLTAITGCRPNAAKDLSPAEQVLRNIESAAILDLAAQHFVEGNNALRRGDSALALRFFETALVLDTNSQFLQNRIIELAVMTGVPASAVMAIQRGRLISELDDDDLRRLTIIFLRFRAYRQAFESVNAIREKNRSDTILIAQMALAENLIVIGSLFNARGDHDSAIIAFNRVLDLGIKTPEILFGLGVANERTGEYERAKTYFKETLAMNPRHALAANYLAYMWAERNENLEKALALVLVAIEEEPDNGAYIDTHGWILFRLGQYDEALPLLLRAAELLPDEYVIFYHIARTFLALNNRENALNYFKKANSFEGNPDFERIAEFISELSE